MRIYSGADGHQEFFSGLIPGESIGHDNELQESWEADRLNNPIGCAGLLVYGLVGMAAGCFVVTGIIQAARLLGR